MQTIEDEVIDVEEETTPEEEAPKRSRKVKGSALQSYLWEQVPRQLLQDAKRKAHGQGSSIKAELVRLLRDWTYAEDKP